jgi:hypothetical protein
MHAGTPEWNTSAGGNHDWVEVWDGNVWSFAGAAEYSAAGFNHTWFVPEPARHTVPGSARHAIYAVSWAETGMRYPLMWDSDNSSVNAYDVSEYYLLASRDSLTEQQHASPYPTFMQGILRTLWHAFGLP